MNALNCHRCHASFEAANGWRPIPASSASNELPATSGIQLIGVVLALCFGVPLWMLVAIASNGAGPLGAAGSLEFALFFSPIVGVILPATVRRLNRGEVSSAAWMLALAPLLGVLNGVLFVAAMEQIGHGRSGSAFFSVPFVAIWLWPLIQALRASAGQ